uniref:PIN domain-containing protein n=1 Tax=Neorhizobium sp. EC2-8 TaxID=3129230 RepID=UPI003101235D
MTSPSFASWTRTKNVVKWKRSIDDSELAICVFTLYEKRKGAEAQLKKDPKKTQAKLDAIDEFESSFGPEGVLSLDAAATKEWAAFVGAREKHVMDAGIAAVAKTHQLIIVTRNVEPSGICHSIALHWF